MARMLILLGALVDHPGRRGWTALQEAVNARNEDVALFLLKECSASMTMKSNYELLHLALINHLFALVYYLIDDKSCDGMDTNRRLTILVNILTKDGENVLHIAGQYDITDIDCLNFLLGKLRVDNDLTFIDAGANAHQQTHKTKETPIMSSVRSGNLLLSETLLRRFCPECKDFGKELNGNKQNLLHVAAEGNNEDYTPPDEDTEKRRIECLRYIIIKFPEFIESKVCKTPRQCSHQFRITLSVRLLPSRPFVEIRKL